MTNAQVASDEQGHADKIWVVCRVPEGFRVYSPDDPQKQYLVGGTASAPTCTCAAANWPGQDPDFCCDHVQAVYRELEDDQLAGGASLPPPTPAQAQPAMGRIDDINGTMPTQMVLKRSVSPDGRIDSLSVEFMLGCDTESVETVVDDARHLLGLQASIVESFLEHGRRRAEGLLRGDGHGNGAQQALMTTIDGMQTRWGWRYYINIEVNGETVRLFGTRKQIADHLTAADFPERNPNIVKGRSLNHPCRVVTRLSDDGRYLNIDEVLPINPPQYAGRRG